MKSGESEEKLEKVGKGGEKRPFWIQACTSFFIIFSQMALFFEKQFKMAASGHFGFRFLPKSIGTSLYSMSVATSNMKLIGAFLIKL